MKNYFNCKFIFIALIIGGIFNNKLMGQYIHNDDLVQIGNSHTYAKTLQFNGANNQYQIIQFGGFNGNTYHPSWEIYRPANASELRFRNSSQSTVMTLLDNGNIGIGTTDMPGNYKLYVKDGILTERVKVALQNTSDWADYVFEKDYSLKSLAEVECFILKNKHLPNIPSAEEMVLSGNDLGKTDAMLLEKIEELTLYLIQQQKEIEALRIQFQK